MVAFMEYVKTWPLLRGLHGAWLGLLLLQILRYDALSFFRYNYLALAQKGVENSSLTSLLMAMLTTVASAVYFAIGHRQPLFVAKGQRSC